MHVLACIVIEKRQYIAHINTLYYSYNNDELIHGHGKNICSIDVTV